VGGGGEKKGGKKTEIEMKVSISFGNWDMDIFAFSPCSLKNIANTGVRRHIAALDVRNGFHEEEVES
jgi:hypothetical protein